MYSLDTYTLAVLSISNILIVSGGVALLCMANKNIKGIYHCSSGMFLLSLGFFLLLLRGIIPHPLFILITNGIIYFGAILLFQGIRAIRSFKPISGWLLYGGLAASFSAYTYWLFVVDSMSGRIAVGSPYFAALALGSARTMCVKVDPRDRPVYWLTATALGFIGLVLIARTVEALIIDFGNRVMDPVRIDVANFAAIHFATIVGVFGLNFVINIKLRREIEKLASYDPLTELPNRRQFDDHFNKAKIEAVREQERIALVYMDLNDFKAINDNHGHAVGDELLRGVASRLTRVVRKTECLARISGDEFVLLLRDAPSREDVRRLVERLRNSMAEAFDFGFGPTSISISCGFAIFPEDVKNVSELIRQADLAMYAEKKKNRYIANKEVLDDQAEPQNDGDLAT